MNSLLLISPDQGEALNQFFLVNSPARGTSLCRLAMHTLSQISSALNHFVALVS
ncbi:hypothetical protein QUA52_11955 [Microcoleus sp. N9_A3]